MMSKLILKAKEAVTCKHKWVTIDSQHKKTIISDMPEIPWTRRQEPEARDHIPGVGYSDIIYVTIEGMGAVRLQNCAGFIYTRVCINCKEIADNIETFKVRMRKEYMDGVAKLEQKREDEELAKEIYKEYLNEKEKQLSITDSDSQKE
jgi:hypothetical protein